MIAMRRINEVFTDEEFERLKNAKKHKTWHDFIMELAEDDKDEATKD